MSKLRWPIRTQLRDEPPSDDELRRMFSAVHDRVQPRRRRAWLALAVTAAIACAVWLGVRRPHAGDGPLVVAHGGDSRALTSAGSARTVAFVDGSSIELDAAGVIETVANGASDFELALQSGGAHFAIVDSPRRWTIDAGFAELRATAAKFAVWRSESAVQVQVLEGTIVLRGDQVPGHVRTLSSNQSLRIPAVAAAPATKPVVEASAPSSPPSPPLPSGSPKTTSPSRKPALSARPRPSNVPAPAAPASSWRTLADEKKYDDAYVQLGKEGVTAEAKKVDTVDDLLRLSDVARLSGHPSDALPALERIAREFPSDRRAGIAAFTRGRIHGDDLHDPRSAAEAFAQSLSLGLPSALKETAAYRLVEARALAGDRAGAVEAARQYREGYPTGRFRAATDKLVEPR